MTGSSNIKDDELFNIINEEYNRQKKCLELIASENFTSKAVLQCLGSCLTNKYSEGLPMKRYYGGNEFIDKIEILCQKRALNLFKLDQNEWGVNVQSYSGSPANFAIYTALLKPHDRIMGLDLPDGGHLTHGFMTEKKRISATSIFFESMPYKLDENTGLIDYHQLSKNAKLFKPKIIIAGYSCYTQILDYKKFREICDDVGSYLLCDMSHFSGLVAGEVLESPFPYCDVVMTTTHKTLRGPRGALIFFNKLSKIDNDIENKINSAVFPGLQGGPHNNAIAAIATCLKEADTEEFKKYAKQVQKNALFLSKSLKKCGFKLVSDGTCNHICFVDLKNIGLDGAKVEYLLDSVNITVNKNACPGDKSVLKPSGIRLGTPALTTRGFVEEDFGTVAEFIYEAIKIAVEVNNGLPMSDKSLEVFKNALNGVAYKHKIITLKEKIELFSGKFPFSYLN